MSWQTLMSAASGVSEARKVASWKYGGEESLSTLNAINMLGYTKNINNKTLSKDIWNEKVSVGYRDNLVDPETGNRVNGYFNGNENSIYIDSSYLGNSKEATAKLSTVYAHEGMHYAGYNTEAQAHQNAFNTYGEIAKLLEITGDTDFAKGIFSEALKASNYEQNDRNVQDWLLVKNNRGSYD